MRGAVVINADDFGMTEGVCRSIVTLLAAEAVSNTTIMICATEAFERCRRYRTALAGRAGVHLQLTGDRSGYRPLSPPEEVPSLIDPATGCFKHKDDCAGADPAEVEKEWTRQIVRVAEVLETSPTHLDSHYGVHHLPQLTPVYLRLAAQYKLPVRGAYRPGCRVDGAALGVRASAVVERDWTGQNEGVAALKQAIRKGVVAAQEGVLEVMTHPGFADDELAAASSWTAVRENEHRALLRLAEEGWLKAEGLRLVRFPTLGAV